MANYFARKAGNINATDVWATTPSGTAGDFFPSFTNADVLHSNNFAITVNVNATVAEVRNDNANGATAGGSFTLSNGVTLTANAFAGSTNTNCVNYAGTAGNSANLVGNATGGTSGSIVGSCVILSGAGTLNITGNCTGGSSLSRGAANRSTGTLNITGNCIGGSGAAGAVIDNVGTLNITGDLTANAAVGAENTSTGTMTVVGTINASEFNYGVSGGNRSQVTLLTGPFIASTTFGVNPIGNLAWRWAASLNDQTYITVPTSDLLATRNLVTPDNATNFPSASDVRSAITYGIGGALTGTCAVPPAGSVAFGVLVDNTTGTATLSAAQIWDYALSAITASNTIGTLLKTNIDATISSRSTATTAGIADAVWDEVLTGATHNIAASAGRRLRILDEERIITDGQVQSATTNTVTLEPIGTLCVGQTIVVTDQATSDKQTRFILSFDPGTYTATVDSNWCTVPTAGDEYLLTTVRDPLVTRGDHPAGTVGAEIDEMYLLQGLKSGSDLTVTPTSRTAGAISQTISGDGTTTTTVSRD